MAQSATKTFFLIVGLPRSGTSSIAQFLDHLGVYFGDPAHFLDTAVLKHNPVFYELKWINDFNDRVMAAWNSSYVQEVLPADEDFERPEMDRFRQELRELLLGEFGERAMVGVKDPRICFTFPLWQRVLTEMGYSIKTILTLRSPSAIVKSNQALMPGRVNWWQRFYARHLLSLRYFTRAVPVVQFDYDLFMQNPISYGKKKAAELGLEMPDPQNATRHLSKTHYHHQPDEAGTGDSFVDRIDAELRDGSLDPNEYLRFRSIAMLFADGQRELQAALAMKDSYIGDIEAMNRKAVEADAVKDQHIAKLESQYLEGLRKLGASKDEHIAKLESQARQTPDLIAIQVAEIQQLKSELEQARARAELLAAAERRCAELTQQLNELRARRLVRLMHLLDRAGKSRSEPVPP